MEDSRVNIPKSLLFFLKTITDRLNKKGWTINSLDDDAVVIVTRDHPYYWGVQKLVEKHLSKKGWICKMTSYNRGQALYSYTYTMRKIKS